MRRRAFTLLEMTISIVILFIMVALFAEFTQTINRKTEYFSSKKELDKKQALLYETLFYDIFLSDLVVVRSNPSYDVLALSTKNSMYEIARPYVLWYALKEKGRLVRIESPNKIETPIAPSSLAYLHTDVFYEKTTLFKVLKHKELERYAVAVEGDNLKLLLSVAKK